MNTLGFFRVFEPEIFEDCFIKWVNSWVLDASLGDDDSRTRQGNAPRTTAVIKKTVLNLLNIVKKDSPRRSLKRMRVGIMLF